MRAARPRPAARLGALLTTTAAAAVLLPAAPAAAERDVHDDARKDVVRIEDDGEQVPVPTKKAADVVRSVVDHTDERLEGLLALRAFPKSATWSAVWQVHTDEAARFTVTLLRYAGQTTLTLTDGDGAEVACDGTSRNVDVARARLAMGVPRSCLGDPAWVRVGVGFGLRGYDTAFADDARRNGRVDPARLRKGPELAPGG